VAALLVDDDAKPINQRTIVFTLGSGPDARKCSGVTRADGVARCQIGTSQLGGNQTVFMDFTGDPYYESAAAMKSVVLNPPRWDGSRMMAKDRVCRGHSNPAYPTNYSRSVQIQVDCYQ
jgi:hypothetical protein